MEKSAPQQPPISPPSLTQRLGIRYPIFQAPLPEYDSANLIAAISNEGGLGSLAGGFLSLTALEKKIKAVKQKTTKPFVVNLFSGVGRQEDKEGYKKALARLKPLYESSRVSMQTLMEESGYLAPLEQVIALLEKEEVKVVSFSLGIPPSSVLMALKEKKICIIGHATHMLEALLWQERGADIIYLQGSEAAGLRQTFLDQPERVSQPALTLIEQAKRTLSLPFIIEGDFYQGAHLKLALHTGAHGVALGTAFLLSDESSLSEAAKNLIKQSNEFDHKLSREWTGHPARVIVNEGVRRLQKLTGVPAQFPQQYFLTHPLRESYKPGEAFQARPLWVGRNAPYMPQTSVKALFRTLLQAL